MAGRFLALVIIALLTLASLWSDAVDAQSFYKGKTVRVVVGSSAGGGLDTYARVLARYLGKHIPGNPTVIVENMPGAGGLVAANHLYRVARPDGLTIGHFLGSLLLGQAIGQPGIEFDARKFEFIGAAVKEDVTCALTKASGITTFEQWMASKTPIKLGATGPGAPPFNTPRILKAALGLPVQLVSGYKGTAEIRLAAEAGEVAGACWAWESMKVTWRKALETGEANVVLQVTATPISDLGRVPLAMDFARTDDARRLIQIGIHDSSIYARPFMLPPGTPSERVRILRQAFQSALEDRALVDEADKANLRLDPVSGDHVHRAIVELFALDPKLVARLKEILHN
jgi:tripartite-type tricarboxylate transporter receptor subunit TctC